MLKIGVEIRSDYFISKKKELAFDYHRSNQIREEQKRRRRRRKRRRKRGRRRRRIATRGRPIARLA